MKAQRIQYRIMDCGGEEPGYASSELMNINSKKGWQSPRFCNFPLELIIQFPSIIDIEYLQILSHQFKIPQFIDISIGQTENDFTELGSIEFSNNMRLNFQMQELKTVQIRKASLFIKLVIHKNHINKLNIFNQVGIMMFQIYGYPASDAQLKNVKLINQSSLQNKISELQGQKNQAIQNEDYKEAQRIKIFLDRINLVKQAQEHLEMQKKQAINREDFETAQIFKQEIQKINESFDNLIQQDNEFQKNDENNLQQLSNISQIVNNQNSFLQNQQNDQSFNQLNLSNIVEQSFEKKKLKYEEQVVPALKNKIDEQHHSYGSQDHFLQDEEVVYEIYPDDQKIIDQFQQVFTKEPLIQVLNKLKWQDRVDALKFIDKEILNPTVIDKKDENLYTLGITYLVMISFRDKINQVMNQGILMFKSFLTTENDIKSSKGDIQANIDQIFQILLEKLSDFNVKEQLSQLFLIMSQNQMIHLNYCLNALLKYKKLKSPRNIVSRIEIILVIIQKAEQSMITDQLFQMILEFTIYNLKDNNQEVRKSAINLIVQLYKINPQKIKENQIPQLQGVQQKFDEIDGKEYKCDYCQLINKDFYDQKKLDKHHKNFCFMITICKACGLQVEILNYNNHLVNICKRKKDFKQCPKCNQSIVKSGYDAHLKLGCEEGIQKCPICQLSIENNLDGLRDHLTLNKCRKNKKLSIHL